MLGKLDTLELSATRLAFADAAPSAARVLRVTGRDGEGFTAPLELADLELDYDRSLLDIEQVATGLRLTPKVAGGTTLVVRAAGKTARLPVTIGVSTENVYTFDHADEPTRWNPNGTAPATQQLSMQDGRLKLTYQARRNMGITWRTAATRPAAPGAPLRIRVRLWSQNALEYSNITYVDAGGTSRSPLGSPIRPGWNTYEWTLPAGVRFPIRVSAFQVIETNVARQADGAVIFDKLEVDNAVEVPSPPLEPLREDPMFSADGNDRRRLVVRDALGHPVHGGLAGAGQDRHRRAQPHPHDRRRARRAQRRHHRPRRRPPTSTSRGRRSRPAAAT